MVTQKARNLIKCFFLLFSVDGSGIWDGKESGSGIN
jgi:hypothetical protein